MAEPLRERVPSDLVECEQWVCWREQSRDGKATKVPIDPRSGGFASTTESETWTDFDTAFDALNRPDVDGIGFVFTEGDEFVGVDLDDCRDAESGEPDPWVTDVIDRLESYTEVSPSGTGYHVLLRGELPAGGNRSGAVEMYERSRFFTMTGEHVDVTPTEVEYRQEALESVHRTYVQSDPAGEDESESETGAGEQQAVDVTDEELLERARNAKNGDKFQRLWNGQTGGYESHSEADMALCCLLAFWTGGDASRVDRLFRQSGLMREKWDEVHYADGRTYGETTVERAIMQTDDVYEPSDDPDSGPKEPAGDSGDWGSEKSRRRDHANGSDAMPMSEPTADDLKQRVAGLEVTVEHLESSVADLEAELAELRRELGMESAESESTDDGALDGWMGSLHPKR